MQNEVIEIDNLDKEILTILINDARVPFTEIAKKLNVSGGTVHFRIKKLEDAGVIKGSNLNVNPARIGYDIVSYVGLNLRNGLLDKDCINILREIPEIVELHVTTGNYTLLAKIICKDTKHLYRVLSEKVQMIEDVQKSETFISMEEIVNRPLSVMA